MLVIRHNILSRLHLLLLLCHVGRHLSLGLVLHLKLGKLMLIVHLVGLGLLLGIHELLLALLALIELHLLLRCSGNAHVISLVNPLIVITHHTLIILDTCLHIIASLISHHNWLLLMLRLFGGLT